MIKITVQEYLDLYYDDAGNAYEVVISLKKIKFLGIVLYTYITETTNQNIIETFKIINQYPQPTKVEGFKLNTNNANTENKN